MLIFRKYPNLFHCCCSTHLFLLFLFLIYGTLHILNVVPYNTTATVLDCACSANQSEEILRIEVKPNSNELLKTLRTSNDPDNPDNRTILKYPYTQDFVECETFAFLNKDLLLQHRKATSASSARCSPEVFREYVKKNDRFYADAAWYAPDQEKVTGAQVYPQDCLFDGSLTATEKFGQCLEDHHIKKAFIYGDSNGFRFFEAFYDFIKGKAEECTMMKWENRSTLTEPDPYYDVPGAPTVQKFRGCMECHSQIHHCWGGQLKTAKEDPFIVEYAGVLRSLERRILKYPKTQPVLENSIIDSDNFAEFLMQRYFKHHGFPDLWVFSFPMHHEADYPFETVRKDLSDLAKIVGHYLPTTTKLVLLPNIRMCPLKSGWEFLQRFQLEFHRSKNEVMHYLNQILFEEFKNLIVKPNSNVYGFMDLGILSCPVMCLWHEDGAHMRREWYTLMTNYVFQLLCSENLQ